MEAGQDVFVVVRDLWLAWQLQCRLRVVARAPPTLPAALPGESRCGWRASTSGERPLNVPPLGPRAQHVRDCGVRGVHGVLGGFWAEGH